MNRYLGALFLGVCLSSTATAGCGDDSAEDDDGGSNAKEATVNEAGAASVVASSTSAVGYLGAGDGASAALSFAGVGTSAFSLITPSSGQTQSLPELPTLELGTASSALCEESCTGDATSGSCTFTGCVLGDGATASWTIEGSVSWTASHLDCDLSYSGDSSGFTYAMNIECNVDYTTTSIDGTVSTDGSYTATADGQTYEAAWDASVVYNDVLFPDGGGCPTDGSVDLDASITVSGQTYEGSGSVSFPSASCAG